MLVAETLLPVAPVGRETERRAVSALLGHDPLVTVSGPRGIGKTTLATLVLERFPRHRVVPLRGIDSAEGIRARFAAALGIVVDSDAALAFRLRRDPGVFLLDHVDDALRSDPVATRSLLGRLAAVPFLHLLVTAADATGVSVESHYPLSPLRDEADRLLPGFVAPDIAQRLLMGNPLALRLAAPLASVDPETLWEHLEAVRRTTADPLDALLDTLGEMAVRRMGYVLPEAAALAALLQRHPAGFSPVDLDAVLSEIAPEAAQELERAHVAGWEFGRMVPLVHSERRGSFPLLDLLSERLEVHGAARAQKLHDQIGSARREDAVGAFVADAPILSALARDARNLEAWSRLTPCVPRLLAHAGCRTLAGQLAAALRTRCADSGSRSLDAWQALLQADLALADNDPVAAAELLDAAEEGFGRGEDGVGQTATQLARAGLAEAVGDDDAAVAACARALRSATRHGDLRGQADALRALGRASRRAGDASAIRDAYGYARSLYDELGDPLRAAACRLGEGETYLAEGRLEDAFDAFAPALDTFRSAGGRGETATVLLRLAEVVARSGDPMRALLVADESLELFRAVGDVRGESLALAVQRRAFVALRMPEPAMASLHLMREALRVVRDPRALVCDRVVGEVADALEGDDAPAFLANLLSDAESVRGNGVEETRTVLRLQEKMGGAA